LPDAGAERWLAFLHGPDDEPGRLVREHRAAAQELYRREELTGAEVEAVVRTWLDRR
jgi:hypothetical protein